MTRNLLVILFSMPLAFGAGCEDTDNDRPGEEPDADADTDSDTDSDTDTDFSASIVATIPFEGVGVYVSDDSGAIVKDVASCEGMTCTYQVPETGKYTVEAEDTYTFVPHKVFVDKPGEFQVSWIEGGCASDSDWAADGPCDEWVPGEYGFAPLEGHYTDEIWGAELDLEVLVNQNDGEIVLEGIDATMGGGNTFYWFNDEEEGIWQSGIVIDENTFSMRFKDAYGNQNDYLFHRD